MYCFIVNPVSGSGRGRKIWKSVKAELDRLGIDYRSYLLTKAGEAAALARGISTLEHPVTLVAIGGDGTINEILCGLASFRDITFACIPTGSGNDFIRGLRRYAKLQEMSACPTDSRINLPYRQNGKAKKSGYSRNAKSSDLSALHAILHAKKTARIDVGRLACTDTDSHSHAREYAFAVSAGIGFDAAVCYFVLQSRLKKVLNRFHAGKLIYLLTALWQLASMKCQTLSISVDGGEYVTYENAYFAAAMNLSCEGGGFMFAPDALPGDGALDLVIANRISKLRLLTLLPLAFSGRHVGHDGVTILRCRNARIQSQAPLHLHTDGEPHAPGSEIVFSLRNEQLKVILP